MSHLQFVALAYLLSAVILALCAAYLLAEKKRLSRKLRALEQQLAQTRAESDSGQAE